MNYLTAAKEFGTIAITRPLEGSELSKLVEAMDEARKQRLIHDRESKKLKDAEVAINALVIDQLRKNPLNFIVGEQTVQLSGRIDEPTVTDWEALWAHIFETENPALLEKRVLSSAIKEIWAAGSTVPGVAKYPTYKLIRS